MDIENQINALKSKLTGNLLEDCEVQSEIYELKKQLALQQGITIEQLEDSENDEGCLYCGS